MRTSQLYKMLRVKDLPAPGYGFVWSSPQTGAGVYTAIFDQVPAGTLRFSLGHDSWRTATICRENVTISPEAEAYLEEFVSEIRRMDGPQTVSS